MPSQPFQSTFSDCRTIEIPSGLDADVRKRFVSRINEAVGQQVELSRTCDAVLKLSGDVREEGERLIISHERAAPADPGAIVNDESRPDIQTLWWLTWSTARALQAAAEQNVTHGGIQFACVYRDEAGRVKLGDFGIAQAFETVCGIDGRRYVACTSEPQADGPWDPSASPKASAVGAAMTAMSMCTSPSWIACQRPPWERSTPRPRILPWEQ